MKDYFAQMFNAALKFGLRPRDFWCLSLCEWRALFAQPLGFRQEDLIQLIEKLNEE